VKRTQYNVIGTDYLQNFNSDFQLYQYNPGINNLCFSLNLNPGLLKSTYRIKFQILLLFHKLYIPCGFLLFIKLKFS